jgi:UDP-2,4-diacetamido-2,4,6-trideoxy-beta-L-altropyranose hydrolase
MKIGTLGVENDHAPFEINLLNANLHIQSSRMAEMIAAADCAVGAAGSTTWGRCALGLPGLVTILVDNQASIAEAVAPAGGHQLLGWYVRLTSEDYAEALFALDANKLGSMSQAAAKICDGRGAERIAARLVEHRPSSHRCNGKLYA